MKVYSYNNEIYPRMLYVVYIKDDDSIEELLDAFIIKDANGKVVDGKGSINTLQDAIDSSDGLTLDCYDKTTRLKGAMVILKEDAEANTLVHESVHVADYIFQGIGALAQEYSETNEPYVYLVEWVFGKLQNSLTKVNKENERIEEE